MKSSVAVMPNLRSPAQPSRDAERAESAALRGRVEAVASSFTTEVSDFLDVLVSKSNEVAAIEKAIVKKGKKR